MGRSRRRRYLTACGALAMGALAGCSSLGMRGADEPSDDAPSWETFEYSGEHELVGSSGGEIAVIEEFDGSRNDDVSEYPDVVEFLEETNFRANYVIAIQLVLPRSPYGFEVTDVSEDADRGVVVEGVRTGDGATARPTTLVTTVRVPNLGSAPQAAWARYEREHPRGAEDKEAELFNGPGFTELSLATTIEDGEPVYERPDGFQVGESRPMWITITNEEHTTIDYTVVVQQQEVTDDLDVRESEELGRFERELDHGEEWIHEHTVTPTTSGETRLAYLLYKRDPPAKPTKRTSDESVHLWIDVEDGDDTSRSEIPRRRLP